MRRTTIFAALVMSLSLPVMLAAGPQGSASQRTPATTPARATPPAQTPAAHPTTPAQQSSGTQSSAPQVGVISAAGPASSIRPVQENHKFPNGTTWRYNAEWRLWSAGTATIRLDAMPNGEQHVTANAESTGAVAVLYRVADHFESFFDHRTFCSIRVNKHTEEGFRRRDTNILFDYARRKAVLDEKNLKTGEAKHAEEDIPNCVTDVLSGLYYLSSLPLEPGSTYLFPINDGGKTYNVRAYVEGREEITTDAGVFRAVRVQPSSDSGPLKSRGKIWIWFSDDAAHIPVQMRARLFWGTLTFRLARVEK